MNTYQSGTDIRNAAHVNVHFDNVWKTNAILCKLIDTRLVFGSEMQIKLFTQITQCKIRAQVDSMHTCMFMKNI